LHILTFFLTGNFSITTGCVTEELQEREQQRQLKKQKQDQEKRFKVSKLLQESGSNATPSTSASSPTPPSTILTAPQPQYLRQPRPQFETPSWNEDSTAFETMFPLPSASSATPGTTISPSKQAWRSSTNHCPSSTQQRQHHQQSHKQPQNQKQKEPQINYTTSYSKAKSVSRNYVPRSSDFSGVSNEQQCHTLSSDVDGCGSGGLGLESGSGVDILSPKKRWRDVSK
jgi:hypothetical protein